VYRDMGERRKFLRIRIRLPLQYKNLDQPPDSYISSISKDISQNGVCFISHKFIPISTRMVTIVNLDYPKLSQIKAISKLAWIQKNSSAESYCMGLEFLAMTREDSHLLSKVLTANLT